MRRRISNYIFSLLVFATGFVQAQMIMQNDSMRNPYIPTGVRIGVDVVAPIVAIVSKDFKGWELNADTDFKNSYLVLEVGHWAREMVLENGDYSNSGNYWRVGVDANFLKKDPDKNMFFFGFRFGHSRFNEKLDYIITTPEFGSVPSSLENKNFKANWLELTTGLKVKIMKSFWMGYTGRIKLYPSFSKDQQLQTYDIPGYGLTFKKPWWGFSYYLMYRIPLVKKR